MKAFLLTLVLGTGYYQVGHGGFRVHEIYRNRHDVVVGEYTQWHRGMPFVAQCVGAQAITEVVYREKDAQRWVEHCPGARD
jgi:hypothetical protein